MSRRRFMGKKDSGINADEAPNGVYIYRSDFKLYTKTMWNIEWNAQALGIALITDKVRFVISPSGDKKLQWGKYGRFVTDCYTTSSSSAAKTDYKGYANSAAIIATEQTWNNGNYCAKYCENFSLPNGEKGYQLSEGEWVQAKNYKSDIDYCLNLIKAEPIATDETYHTSTQYDENGNWYHHWVDGTASWIKNKELYIRPCFRLV